MNKSCATEIETASDALIRHFKLIARIEGVSQRDLQWHLMERYVNTWLTQQGRFHILCDVLPSLNPSRKNVSFNISLKIIGLELSSTFFPLTFMLPVLDEPYEAWRIYPQSRFVDPDNGVGQTTKRQSLLLPHTVSERSILCWEGHCFVFDPQFLQPQTFQAKQKEIKQKVEESVRLGIQAWADTSFSALSA